MSHPCDTAVGAGLAPVPRPGFSLLLSLLLPLSFVGAVHGQSSAQGAPARHPRDILVPSLPPYAPPLPRSVVLEGGVEVHVQHSATTPVLSGVIRFPAGAVDEPAGIVGVAPLLADVMTHAGSATHPAPALQDWLAAQGAELTCEARREAFELRFACPPEAWSGLVDRIGSILREPAVTPDTLAAARLRLAALGAHRRADPVFVADWALAVVAYGAESAYARQPSPASLQAITVDDLLKFSRGQVRGARPVVGLIGTPSDEQIAALGAVLAPAADAEGGAEGGSTDGAAPPVRATDGSTPFAGFIQPARTRVWVVDRPQLSFAEVRLAAPGVRRLDPDASQLELWSRIVGRGGTTQRLGTRFPDRSVEAGFLPEWNRAGAFLARFSSPTDEVGEILRGMLEVLEQSKTAIDEDDVKRVRRRLMNEELVAADSAEKSLARFLDLVFHGYPEDFYRQRVLSWRNARPSTLVEAVESRLDLGRMVVVAVGPIEQLREHLAPFGPVEELSLEQALAPGAAQPDVVQAMFEALGGRQAWADAAAVHAQIDIVLPDREIPSRQWSDLGGPRFRAEYLVGSETVVLVVDGERALQVTAQGRKVLDAAAHRAQLEAKRRALWEVLHRMARSSGVRVQLDEDRNLSVRDDAGLDVMLELDARGLPVGLTERGTAEGKRREFLDWRTDGELAYPGRIVETGSGMEWRVNALEPLGEFDALLLDPGR